MASSSGSKFSNSFPTRRRPYRPYVPRPFPTSAPESFPFDVFLSFRGVDTRNNFTGHLHKSLIHAGIHTFMDDPELHKGRDISLELMRAIEESRIYIVVFSRNYASSRWCLDELVKIMECKKLYSSKVVLPVFYDVRPYEVRGPYGSFKKALSDHEVIYLNQLDMVKGWRSALHEAANMSGFDLQGSAHGSESRLISLIVREVAFQVMPRKLFVAKYPVGLDSRINEASSLLRPESEGVLSIGIWGMGGSGKIVIAKSLYNQILQSFDLSCFLANVREVSGQQNGLVSLQEQLISELPLGRRLKLGMLIEE